MPISPDMEIAAVSIALVGYAAYREWLRHQRRALIHHERLAAIEKGLNLPPLEQEQKVFTGDPLHAGSAFEVVSKLALEDEVDSFDLLFLAQLLTVANERLAATQGVTMLSGRLRTTFFNRASGFVTTIALQKQFRAFATAKATHSISIPSQLIASSLTLDGKVYRLRRSANPSSFGLKIGFTNPCNQRPKLFFA